MKRRFQAPPITVREVCIVATSVVIAFGRIGGIDNQSYQAIAHLWVGGLFGAFFVGRERWYLWQALALSVVEVLCFLAFRFLGKP